MFKRTIGHAGEGVKPKLFHFYLTARQSLRRGNPIKVKKFRFDPYEGTVGRGNPIKVEKFRFDPYN